ncbi:apolipoprotein D [Oryzias melastigma]|uniref:Apolipoprotein D n=1 Tax=Oryzias melastigma TaxID=30732 RepID=A0A3B3B4Z0_ORYME|nr:apolipoprotein D [Oryzias melastigma]XP_024135939.1 apolipoprotein D [Oryzias melastigma]XP_024135940.1 apolipoprotein D [Oryzias melastigma]
MRASLVLLLLLPLASAQTFGWGPCKTPEVQANFTLEEFVGSWYLVQKLPAFSAPGKCIRSNLTLMENATVHVTNSHFLFGREWHFDGVLVTPHSDEPAKLLAHFGKFVPPVPDWVLATDYSSHAVVYSCMDFYHVFHVEYAWIFSRSPSLTPEVLQRCREVLEEEGVKTSRLQEVDQDCMEPPLSD